MSLATGTFRYAPSSSNGAYLHLTFGWRGIARGPSIRWPDGSLGFQKGGMLEKYAFRENGIEQIFLFDAPPRGEDLVVEGAFETNLTARKESDSEIAFYEGTRKRIFYRDALALDAGGRTLPLPIELCGHVIRLTVPRWFVDRATLPLMIDPLIGTPVTVENVTPDATANSLARHIDIAKGSGSEFVAAYAVKVSGNNHDIKLARFTADYTTAPSPTITSVSVNASTYESEPAIAYNSTANKYLVVYTKQALDMFGNLTGTRDVIGRIYDPSTDSVGGEISIATDSMRNEQAPDVTFDGTRWLVAFEREDTVANFDIYAITVAADGSLGTLTAVDTALADQRSVSLARLPGATTHLIVWRHMDIAWNLKGRIANTSSGDPTFSAASFTIADTGKNLTAARDLAGNSTNSEWLVPYEEEDSVVNRNIFAVRVSSSGTVGTPFQLESAASDARWPACTWSSLSNRYLVVWHDFAGGADSELVAARTSGGADTILENGIAITSNSADDQSPSVALDSTSNLAVIASVFLNGTQWACTVQRFSMDYDAPAGSISINSGAIYTNSTSVAVTNSISDSGGSGLKEMRFSEDGGTSWSAWEPYAASASRTLPAGDGTKTIVAEFKDYANNVYQTSDTITLDQTPPTLSITIDSGATYSSSTSVTITLTASDALSGLNQMRFQNELSTWSSWEPYASTRSWTLTSSNGTKTVNAQVRDSAGNSSATATDTIILDTVAPTGSITIDGGAATKTTSATLTLSASDSGSGVSDMRFSNDGTSWSLWEPYATSRSWTLAPASPDGTRTVYCEFRDGIGNISSTYSDSIELDTTNPAGSIVINSGAASTNSTTVTLTLTGSDAGPGGVVDMRFSNDGSTWSGWEAFSTTKSWTIPVGDGAKTVYLELRDAASNVGGPFTDTITLDQTAPTGSVTINSGAAHTGSTSVTLTLSASDGGTGVTQMRFSNDGSAWSAWEAYATSKSWTLASGSDGLRTVYVQFLDGANNPSSTTTDSIDLDTTAPTGSVSIDSGNAYTASTTVTLTLSASDGGSGVSEMRFSNDGSTWSGWEPYATSKTWTLPSGDGSKTVYVQFRDGVQNAGSASDSITLDTTGPTGGIAISGDAAGTNSTSVTLNLNASDAGSGVFEMRFSEDGSTWTLWEAFAATKPWTLPAGDGTKTLYVQFRDTLLNAGATYSDTIVLDTVAPGGTISINSGATWTTSAAVTLNLTVSDPSPSSGNLQMRFSNDGVGWSAWEAFSTTRTWTLSSGDGAKTVYAEFRDAAANSSGSLSDGISLDSAAPTGTATINNGDTHTTTEAVTLTLSATDPAPASGVSEMQFSNDGTFYSAWEPYATSQSWTVTPGSGLRTVYVRYRDVAGNVVTVSDTIVLDTQPPDAVELLAPANGSTLTATSVSFDWTPGGDNLGIAYYELQVDDASDFTSPNFTASPTADSLITPLADGTWYWRVRAIDNAGLQSSWSAIWSFVKDSTEPNSTISTSGSYGPSNWAGAVSGTASDSGSGVVQMNVRLQRGSDGQYWNGSTWQTSPVWLTASGTSSWTYAISMSNLSDGETYTTESRATDGVGIVETTFGSSTFTFDSTPPTSTISTTGAYTESSWPGAIQGTATDGTSGVSGVQIQVQRASDSKYWTGATWSTSPGWVSTYFSAGAWSRSFTPQSGESYTVTSRSTDLAGNEQSPPTSGTFSYTDTSSGSTLNSFVSSSGYYNSASWPGVVEGVATGTGLSEVRVRIQRLSDAQYWTGAGWGGSTWLTATGTSSWSLAFSSLTDGETYMVESKAVAGATVESAPLGQGTFMYDTTLPISSVQTTGAYNAASWTGLSGACSDPPGSVADASGIDVVQVSIQRTSDGKYFDGATWVAVTVWLNTSGNQNRWSYPLIPASGTTYLASARAIDRAGNVQSPAASSLLTYDNAEPESEIATTGIVPPYVYPGYVHGTAFDVGTGVAAVHVSIRRDSDGQFWNGSGWAPTETWLLAVGTTAWKYAFTPMPKTGYRIRARAQDAAGNIESAPDLTIFGLLEGPEEGGRGGGGGGGCSIRSVTPPPKAPLWILPLLLALIRNWRVINRSPKFRFPRFDSGPTPG